jgi:hypothetical protein
MQNNLGDHWNRKERKKSKLAPQCTNTWHMHNVSYWFHHYHHHRSGVTIQCGLASLTILQSCRTWVFTHQPRMLILLRSSFSSVIHRFHGRLSFFLPQISSFRIFSIIIIIIIIYCNWVVIGGSIPYTSTDKQIRINKTNNNKQNRQGNLLI